MTGHQKAQQLKKQNGQQSRFSLMKSSKQREQRPVSQQSQQHQQQHQQQQQQQEQLLVINVDELASKKVQEVEQSLEAKSGSDFKLDTFTAWFSVLKQIITAADLHRTNDKNSKSALDGKEGKHETGDSIYADYSDDNEHFTAHVDLTEQFATNSVKWTIRVRAFKIVHRLVSLVIGNSNPTPSSSAPSRIWCSLSSTPQAPPKILIKHLPDLVRLSFVAATSPYDELKMQGFEMFRILIDKFGSFEEPEFPGHSILEQYKTQVLSAVKPAFNLDAPPYITAIASQICSLWICQGLEKNLTDVKRTYQLMSLSIEKLEGQSVNQHSKLYTESELEQERVDILGSWAQLYIASEESKLSEQYGRVSRLSRAECENLKSLVNSQIETLVDKWWEAMKDYALLIMPAPRFIGTSHDNEHVYTREVALRLFSPTWPKLVLALTIWLCKNGEDSESNANQNETTQTTGSESTTTNNLSTTTESSCDNNLSVSCQKRTSKAKYCKFLCGVIMKELSKCMVNKSDTRTHLSDSTVLALRSINLLLTNMQLQHVFLDDLAIAQEFYGALYNMTILCRRDSTRFVLRNTLDLLFQLIVGKIKAEERNIHYGIAKLISSLMTTMRDLEIACNEKCPADLDANRMHLSVRLQNLLTLIKSAPDYAMNEAPLQEALIAVFQEMLRFRLEPSVSLTLADHLKDLYVSINNSAHRKHIIDELYPELCARVEELLAFFSSSDKHSELDNIRLAQIDTFLRSMRVAIEHLDSASRTNKIEQYASATLKALDASLHDTVDDLISNDSKKKRELIEYCMSHVSVLQKSYPSEFSDDSFDTKIKERIDRCTKLHQDIKSNLDSQNKKLQSARKPGAPGSQKPRVAKIALKADFSNFYSKKPS